MAATLARFYGELAGTVAKPPRRFSPRRMFREMAEHGGLDTGYEKEVCSAAAMIGGGTHDRNRVIIPWGAIGRRDLLMANTGGYLAGTETPSAIDALEPWSVAAKAGITVFENLRENLAVPRDATAPTGQWLTAETTSISETTPVLSEVPHMYGVLIQFSTRFLQQATKADNYLATRLLRAAARALDVAILGGAGGAEPQGRCVLAMWGSGLRVEVNPFQDFSKGILAARVIVAADVCATQPTAFVKSDSIT